MQLQPGEMMAIVRQLADPNDAGTYYVRATIRNARTDALIDTKDLTDRTGQRFSVEYQVPSKSSDAIYISISTRVYTDSGYTTLSDMYGQEIETYLVEMRQQHFGGGGGSGISYKKIEETVRAVLKEMDKPDAIDVKGIVDKALQGAVGDIKGHTEQVVESARTVVPPVDFSSVLRGIERTSKLLERVVTEMPKTVREEIAPHMEDLSASIEKVKDGIDTVKGAVESSASDQSENHNEIVSIFSKGSDETVRNMKTEMVKKLQGIIEGSGETNTKRWQDAIKDVMKKP